MLQAGAATRPLEADASLNLELGLCRGESPMVLVFPIVVNADLLSPSGSSKPCHEGPRGTELAVFDLHRDDEQHSIVSCCVAGTVMAAVTATPETGAGLQGGAAGGACRYRAVTRLRTLGERWLCRLKSGVGRRPPTVSPRCGLRSQGCSTIGDHVLETPGRVPGAVDWEPASGPRHMFHPARSLPKPFAWVLGWGLLAEAQCGREIARGSTVELAPLQQPWTCLRIGKGGDTSPSRILHARDRGGPELSAAESACAGGRERCCAGPRAARANGAARGSAQGPWVKSLTRPRVQP